jgi:hypothetical protein
MSCGEVDLVTIGQSRHSVTIKKSDKLPDKSDKLSDVFVCFVF